MRSISVGFLITTAISTSPTWAQNPTAPHVPHCDQGAVSTTPIGELTTELAERREFVCQAMREQAQRLIEQAEARKRLEQSTGTKMLFKLSVSTLVPFADWDFYWVNGSSIVWTPNPGQHFQRVSVPIGFVTDLASIPRAFWQVLRPEGRHAHAAAVHDYLYWGQTRPREEADEIFKFALEDSKVDPSTVTLLYQSVRKFGQQAWNQNARLKAAGECRFIYRLPPSDLLISWSEWKQKPGSIEKCMPYDPSSIWLRD